MTEHPSAYDRWVHRCREHGLPLTPTGVCAACYWRDRAELLALFDEIIDPIREELEAHDV